ncbi:MAG: Uma2 family endonuclease [Candidatus Poribacteria bacterium]|nr:Uma2 family endonuclease [Candidatus Poribacteria bacterium]
MTVERTVEEESQVEDRKVGEVHAQPTIHIEDVPPPLKHGDQLTREEFERRYEAMPHLKKAELIEGVVYVPSPVRFDIHSEPHADVMIWLGTYRVATPGVRLGDNATVYLDLNNELQPDALLRLAPEKGGNSQLSNQDYIEGAPELIVEVAGTSADYDLREKLVAYRRNGVQEYIVWRTQDGQLDWFHLIEGDYVPLTPDADNIIESQVFPGLRLAVGALLEGDLATVLFELQNGLVHVGRNSLPFRWRQSDEILDNRIDAVTAGNISTGRNVAG